MDKIPEHNIVNVIAYTDIGEKLDLASLNQSLSNCEYIPEVYFALIYRLQEPKLSILLNKSGKIIFTGARGIIDIETSRDLLFDDLIRNGYFPLKNNIIIQNIVISTMVDYNIDFEGIQLNNLENYNIKYDPSVFPGVFIRYSNPKFTAIVFKSGKINIVGLKCFNDIRRSLELVIDFLNLYNSQRRKRPQHYVLK